MYQRKTQTNHSKRINKEHIHVIQAATNIFTPFFKNLRCFPLRKNQKNTEINWKTAHSFVNILCNTTISIQNWNIKKSPDLSLIEKRTKAKYHIKQCR